MDPTIWVNQRVNVVVLFNKNGDISSLAYPYKMKYQGREVVFSKLAFRHPTQRGKRMIHAFDVSDGVNDYRLEFDAENLTWTLIAMIAGLGQ